MPAGSSSALFGIHRRYFFSLLFRCFVVVSSSLCSLCCSIGGGMRAGYLSLGANMGDRAANIRRALRLLCEDGSIRLLTTSFLYFLSSSSSTCSLLKNPVCYWQLRELRTISHQSAQLPQCTNLLPLLFSPIFPYWRFPKGCGSSGDCQVHDSPAAAGQVQAHRADCGPSTRSWTSIRTEAH